MYHLGGFHLFFAGLVDVPAVISVVLCVFIKQKKQGLYENMSTADRNSKLELIMNVAMVCVNVGGEVVPTRLPTTVQSYSMHVLSVWWPWWGAWAGQALALGPCWTPSARCGPTWSLAPSSLHLVSYLGTILV